ncbi:hypothetical protein PA08_1016 [Cutibacterium modestum P08]|jgi:hypothetical protein|uniref:Uncharacterized protein n=1 Tax=Cutibacterium modestum HL044PA1 TaxID=765109 RepID=A0ABN0C7G2_9ACTN|nr:hypothetical protein HMPREF9607_00660 [Cutibacterium modestum HL044PA1]EGG26781.1 hypothetical protein PA08_1016 [Cutibacterium modestum P08]
MLLTTRLSLHGEPGGIEVTILNVEGIGVAGSDGGELAGSLVDVPR